MKYQFDYIKNGTLEDGPVIVRVIDGVATIDKKDEPGQALARRRGGKPVEVKPTKPQSFKTAKKGSEE